MAKFTQHLFVCCNTRAENHPRGCCDPDASGRLRAAFKSELKGKNLGPTVRANSAGCLDQCELGPVVVIYPQQIWYGGVTLEDVPRIVEKTMVQGEILDDLLIPEEKLNIKGKRLAVDSSTESTDEKRS